MTISSRTPEGSANHCPICDKPVCIEPSQSSGDAPCSHCGTLLWFLPTSAGVHVYETEAVFAQRERIVEILHELLGVKTKLDSPLFLTGNFQTLGVDSLDLVELIMELEEQLGFTIPDAEAEEIPTIGDVIDYLIQRGLKSDPPNSSR